MLKTEYLKIKLLKKRKEKEVNVDTPATNAANKNPITKNTISVFEFIFARGQTLKMSFIFQVFTSGHDHKLRKKVKKCLVENQSTERTDLHKELSLNFR